MTADTNPTRRQSLAVALAMALVLGAACSTDDTEARSEAAGLPSTRRDLESHEWVLDEADSTSAIVTDADVTILFRDDAVSGTGPCNTYRGSLSVEDESITITDLATTRMSCEEPAMESEEAYFADLQAVTTAEVDDDGLRLTLTGDGTRLTFDAIETSEDQ